MGWFERWSRRQDELAPASIRDNRRQLGFLLFGFPAFLSLLLSKLDLGELLRQVLGVVGACSTSTDILAVLEVRLWKIEPSGYFATRWVVFSWVAFFCSLDWLPAALPRSVEEVFGSFCGKGFSVRCMGRGFWR